MHKLSGRITLATAYHRSMIIKCVYTFRVVEETYFVQDSRKHKFVLFKLRINSYNRKAVKDLFETLMIYKAARSVRKKRSIVEQIQTTLTYFSKTTSNATGFRWPDDFNRMQSKSVVINAFLKVGVILKMYKMTISNQLAQCYCP